MLLLSTRRVPRLNIQVPQVRERKKTNDDGTRWRLCWVRTDEHFVPIAPYHLEENCQSSSVPLGVEVPVTTSLPTTVSLSSEHCFGEQATNDEDSNDSVTDLPLDGCTDSDFVTLPVLNNVDEPKRKKKKMCAPQPTMSLSIPGVQPNVSSLQMKRARKHQRANARS